MHESATAGEKKHRKYWKMYLVLQNRTEQKFIY